MGIHYFNNQKKTNIIKKKIIHTALKNENKNKTKTTRGTKTRRKGLRSCQRHPPVLTANDSRPFRAAKYQECLEKVC